MPTAPNTTATTPRRARLMTVCSKIVPAAATTANPTNMIPFRRCFLPDVTSCAPPSRLSMRPSCNYPDCPNAHRLITLRRLPGALERVVEPAPHPHERQALLRERVA